MVMGGFRPILINMEWFNQMIGFAAGAYKTDIWQIRVEENSFIMTHLSAIFMDFLYTETIVSNVRVHRLHANKRRRQRVLIST
jgi:hypothetical protein